jgi:hypothetical protein
MGQVLQFLRTEKAFDSEATAALATAYEKAIAWIEPREQPAMMGEIVARRIIALAAKGVRNPERLCAAAIATVARTVTRTTEPAIRRLPPSA